MGKKTKKKQDARNRLSFRLDLGRVFLGVALLAGAYLAWVSISGGSLAGCGPESSCNKVLQSRWSHWLGIPVSIPALVAYLTLFSATFQLKPGTDRVGSSGPHTVITGLSLLILGAALWFVGLQAVVIRSFCIFCMTAHISGSIAALILISLVRSSFAGTGQQSTGLPAAKSLFLRAGAIALVAMTTLIAGQYLVAKKTFSVATIEASPNASPGAGTTSGRTIPLHNGTFSLKVDELPLIGSKDAPHLIVSLFDYTCHHCQHLHGLLLGAQKRLGNQFAVLSLPVPLDGSCNRWVKKTSSTHANACQHARLGLAVWRAKPEAWKRFDDGVFAMSSPPPLDQVRKLAEEIVGRDLLEKTLQDPWIARRIQENVDIYAANSNSIRSGRMPQLMMGGAISAGSIDTMDQLMNLLRQHLGILAARSELSAVSILAAN